MLANEAIIRVAAFLAVFSAMAVAEAGRPRRAPGFPKSVRWPANLGVAVLNTVVVRLLLPGGAMAVAILGERRGWGLLNNLSLPGWVACAGAVILLDLIIYLQHVMFHAVPALWRIHRMHHADLDFDVTTGVRFHPIEIVLSMVIKIAAVAALGAPALAVLIFEVLLNATSMFNHANLYLPEAVDRLLRWILVTPDMHRVHHSVVVAETNSNFGFNLSWWDRLLGTYRAQPAAGHEAMIIGIEQFRDGSELKLRRMLLQPFRDEVGEYPITWRRSA